MAQQKRCSVLHISYYSSLLHTREVMMTAAGHAVTSALGNEAGKELVHDNDFDVAVVGFSGRLQDRREIVRWLKDRWPDLPVVALQSQSESIDGAECVVSGQDPKVWLDAVRQAARS